MFNYFVVVGIKTQHAESIQLSIDKIIEKFSVENFSKAYIAGSEDERYPGKYINFAFKVLSDLNLNEFKDETSSIENFFYVNGKKTVDLDIILQCVDDNNILFCDSTINRYCHTLVTLNDIIPNQIIDTQTIGERLNNHSNKDMFTEFLECQLKA